MKCMLYIAICLCTANAFVKRQLNEDFVLDNNGENRPSNPNIDTEKENKDEELAGDFLDPRINKNSDRVNNDLASNRQACLIQNRVCVPYHRCTTGKRISNGFGILTTMSGETIHQHSQCPLYLEVCCEGPDLLDSIVDGISNSGLLQGHGGNVGSRKPKCGQRNYNGIGATIGRLNDSFSQFAEFPWMAAVLKQESIAGKIFKLYMCGGSVISNNIILTAAHCILSLKPESILVRVGEWDTQQKSEIYQHREASAKAIIINHDFNPSTLAYDFALIVLKKPIEYSPHIAPICLPSMSDNFDAQLCFATGWGKEQFGEKGTYQNVLKNVDVNVVSRSNCETALKKTRLGQYFQLHNTFTCAGGSPGKDTCGGDGGSPLVCKKDGSYYQAGIVAWGIGCGENGVPGVYADVRKAVQWINAEIEPHRI